MPICDPEYYDKLFTEGKTDIREILASRKKLFDDEVFMQEKCKQFIAGSTFGEYEADIVRYLMLCSWEYSEESAIKLVLWERSRLRGEYLDKTPVEDVALDIGYCCG